MVACQAETPRSAGRAKRTNGDWCLGRLASSSPLTSSCDTIPLSFESNFETRSVFASSYARLGGQVLGRKFVHSLDDELYVGQTVIECNTSLSHRASFE